jgi:hypothetical protein
LKLILSAELKNGDFDIMGQRRKITDYIPRLVFPTPKKLLKSH